LHLTSVITLSCVMTSHYMSIIFLFFFNATTPTEIYTLSLHDALPICIFGATKRPATFARRRFFSPSLRRCMQFTMAQKDCEKNRSEEHTSELQSLAYLVCRLLLEKKKKQIKQKNTEKNKINKNHSNSD